jgi:ATP-dependent Lhr-like helicase
LKALAGSSRLLDGEFRPGGAGREWCDPDVLQSIRRRSLARLRKEVEPVDAAVFGRLLTSWQGVSRPRLGVDALLDAIENLQGAPLPASIFESDILGARVRGYNSADLDALTAAGEVTWCGIEPLGDRDGRLTLFLTDHMSRLWRPPAVSETSTREREILRHLESEGASFFAPIHEAAGGGYPGETVDALWDLVWKGLLTNDTFHALRAFTRPREKRTRKPARGTNFRSRRVGPPSSEGRWSLTTDRFTGAVSPTEWSTATAQQLLSRYGIVTREVAGAEGIEGGFSAVYDVLKAMEDAGRIRRGYFVGGVGAMQFALPAALELMRSFKTPGDHPDAVVLSATDPANPYGTMLKWPAMNAGEPGVTRGPTRTVGAIVILVDGAIAGYVARGGRQLLAYLPEDEPARTMVSRALAARIAAIARGEDGRGGLLIAEINGVTTADHPLAPFLIDAGFYPSAMGFQMRKAVGSSAFDREAPALAIGRSSVQRGDADA